MKFSAFIPIKLNSERVPNKNFYEIGGKPLFYYILSTLQSVELVDEIVIDIDHIEIKEKVNMYFNDIKFNLREDNLSSPTESVNKIIDSNINNFKNEYIIQTHVTNPLLTSSSINLAAEQFIKNKKPLFSVNMFQSRFYNTSTKPINHDVNILLPTQELEPIYEENSNFYIFSKKQFKNNNNKRIGEDSEYYETSKFESFDIDNFDDLNLVEKLMT